MYDVRKRVLQKKTINHVTLKAHTKHKPAGDPPVLRGTELSCIV